MAKVTSAVLVIDCSIAQAAGPEGAEHPTAKHCRDFLEAVRHICHRIGMSPAVAEEWKRHRSGFARQWLVSMHARKKVVPIDADDDPKLRKVLNTSAKNDTNRDAMLKDAHLLEAASQADRRIADLDERVRRLFASVARTYKPIQKMCWVNPDVEFNEIVAWLEAGAPISKAMHLESFPV
jgi:hypothetical protein